MTGPWAGDATRVRNWIFGRLQAMPGAHRRSNWTRNPPLLWRSEPQAVQKRGGWIDRFKAIVVDRKRKKVKFLTIAGRRWLIAL